MNAATETLTGEKVMIPMTTHKNRRMELTCRMGRGIAVIPSAKEMERTPTIPYPFRQNSDFLYLSGFQEPDAVMALSRGKSILFCREKNQETKLWTGESVGTERAVSDFGFDEAYPIEMFEEKMLELLPGQKKIFFPYADTAFATRVFAWIEKVNGKKPRVSRFNPHISDLGAFIAEMRLIKDPEEIELMRKVAEFSAHAHNKAMRACKDDVMEVDIETIFHAECRYHLCDPLHAYPTIVACGKNACVLHYTKNDDTLNDGELVLVDAGGEFGGYAADITRTFPVNGKFSPEQRALYEIVLRAQKTAIEEVRPGNTYYDPHIAAACTITEGLVALGLLWGDMSELIRNESYKKFFPHRTSHWLGLDVHDVGDYKANGEWRELEPGMVLTVEPGIYIQPDDMSVDKKWRGIGIRIEDDVLVTADGCEILSSAVPKEIDEIEKLMKG